MTNKANYKPVIVDENGHFCCNDTMQEIHDEVCGGGVGSLSYSLQEQWTGKYWIDGKKIYQKTINFGALPNAQTKKQPHNINSFDRVIEVFGAGKWIGNNQITIPYASTNQVNCIALYIDNVNINVSGAIDHSSYTETYFTIQYTCTDR